RGRRSWGSGRGRGPACRAEAQGTGVHPGDAAASRGDAGGRRSRAWATGADGSGGERETQDDCDEPWDLPSSVVAVALGPATIALVLTVDKRRPLRIEQRASHARAAEARLSREPPNWPIARVSPCLRTTAYPPASHSPYKRRHQQRAP